MSTALNLDAASYAPHVLHTGERDWAETNCYVDVWIELLHALGHEPLAGLGFTLGIDLEADQWTFFKFPHDELRNLYGIAVIECNPWVSVLEQSVNELANGHPVLIEVDAWFLPDTHGTTYRSSHVKTTIAAIDIDAFGRRLGYFHNQTLHVLDGEDFSGLFRIGVEHHHLPPFIEVAKPSAQPALEGRPLRGAALELLASHVHRVPSNPFVRFAGRFDAEVDMLRTSNDHYFHGYSFAAFRQFGAAFSLAASHLDWLAEDCFEVPRAPLLASGAACRTISATAKALQFRTARAAIANKPLDATPQLSALIDAWDDALGTLRELFA